MSEPTQANSVTGEMLINLENPIVLPVRVISGEEVETSNVKWHVASAFKQAAQLELNSPEVKEKAASIDLLMEIPYRIEKSPPGTLYRVTLQLIYGVTRSPGSRCGMTVQFGGRTKLLSHDFGRNENQAMIVKRYGLNIRAREAREGSLILGITLFAERNTLADHVILGLDTIDVSFAAVNSTGTKRNRS